VKCEEFQDLIAAAVDRYLPGQEREMFEEHARRCPPCRSEYEAELSTKQLIRKRARMIVVPADLQQSILHQLEQKDGASRSVRQLWLKVTHAPLVRPAIALGFTALVALLITSSANSPRQIPLLTTAGFGPNNVIHQSIENFHKILRGDISPQIVSSERSTVENFFSGRTGFPVMVPSMKECTLLGGVLNDHNGTPLAHVVYRAGDDIIYLYQACWETVQKGDVLEIAPEARTELITSGWYSSTSLESDALVLWKSDRTLCVAVSHMQREKLLDYLHRARLDSVASW
jgi:anti-sigma factor RsiW